MFLDEHEVAALLEFVRQQVRGATGRRQIAARLDELIVECLLMSGLRNSEFCRLTVDEAIPRGGRPAFRVRRQRGGDRTVFVPDRVGELVRRFVAEVRPVLLPEGVAPCDPSRPLVFSERHRPYQRTGLYRRVVRILTEAGLGARASVQLLRHTYGYLAYLRTGGNLLFVQRQLGHAHPMVTIVYAQFVAESYPSLADRVGRVGAEVIGELAEATDACEEGARK
jgi:integrase/recombinase XerD